MKLAKFSAKLVANFRRSLEGDFRASFAGEIVRSTFHQNSTANFTIELHYEALGCGGACISTYSSGAVQNWVCDDPRQLDLLLQPRPPLAGASRPFGLWKAPASDQKSLCISKETVKLSRLFWTLSGCPGRLSGDSLGILGTGKVCRENSRKTNGKAAETVKTSVFFAAVFPANLPGTKSVPFSPVLRLLSRLSIEKQNFELFQGKQRRSEEIQTRMYARFEMITLEQRDRARISHVFLTA